MGTDIHLCVEMRDPFDVWHSLDHWSTDEYDEPGQQSVSYENRWYTHRDYDVFAILADVRNGRGFAGIVTGDGFVPISADRGVPDDMSPEVRAYHEHGGLGDHSFSHLTLRDLVEYDWTQRTKVCGVVDAWQWHRWDGYRREHGEMPHEYCADVSGPNIRIVTEPEMRQAVGELRGKARESQTHLDEKAFKSLYGMHTRFVMERTYYQCADSFWSKCMPRLLSAAFLHKLSHDDLRIVFGFDS